MSLFAVKSLDMILADSEGESLKRSLGAGQLVALGIGAIIGAGLFSLTGLAAAQNAGPAVVLSFILAAVGCAFAGLCYSEFATMIPIAGSAYTYSYATMGELMAWIIARPGAGIDRDQVREFCEGRIAHYKIPRYVKVVDQFPMTVTGKVQKFKMREQAIAELDLVSAAGIETA